MGELKFLKNETGRIIKVMRGQYYANIIWADENADIEFCNFIIMIVCTARGVGGKNG